MSDLPFVHAHAGNVDWRVALDSCLGHIAERCAALGVEPAGDHFPLGWCYLSDYYAPVAEAILDELQRRLPGVAWVGASAVGVAASGVEYIDEAALVVMLAPLPRERFRLFSGRHPLPASRAEFAAHTALVHGEGSTPDVQELIAELSGRTATGYLFGGLSSARNRTLHIADGVFTGGLSGVLFSPEVGLVSRVTQGCSPIGPSRGVTRAEQQYVLALDGEPALDCVLEDLGLARDTPLEGLAEALSDTLVGLSRGMADAPRRAGRFGSETVVRHLVGVDPKHGVLAVADGVEPGMQLAFCRRDAESARRDLQRVAGEIRAELDSGEHGGALGAIYVSCSGRGGPHFGAPHAELHTLQAVLGDVPLVGFFAGGEIAGQRLYGYTGVLTVFTERA
jgi:small ligand-binding sensory domain FIST